MMSTICQTPPLSHLSSFQGYNPKIPHQFSLLPRTYRRQAFKWKVLHCQSNHYQYLDAKQEYHSDGFLWIVTGVGRVEECKRKKGMVGLSNINLSRREGLMSVVLLATSITLDQSEAVTQGGGNMLGLERYSDEIQGFTLLKPFDWKKVDKAGATALFEDPAIKTNNIGVVVNPIRISSLKEFGSPQDVADKLLQAEKKKPSTNDAKLIRVVQRPIHGDIPLYELEYSLDSSRGVKRVLSAVTVASKKLYLLNISYSDSAEEPISPNVRMILEQVLDSFDVVN